MLLIAAGLTLRDLMKVQSLDPGIRTENLVAYRADMSFDKFPLNLPAAVRQQKLTAYWTAYEAKLRTIPGSPRWAAAARSHSTRSILSRDR